MAKAVGQKDVSVAQLEQLERGLRETPERLEGDKRAVVACIVRKQGFGSNELEMFFILRASRKNKNGARSRWGGQVGFPGGHVESGETDEQALVRECEEEVGLHLASKHEFYRAIGEIKQRVVTSKGRKLVVCCRVYEQLIREEHKRIQKEEVSACGWCPLSALLSEEYLATLNWELEFGDVLKGFPCVNMPVTISAYDDELNKDELASKFNLWGLTLNMVNDLLVGCNFLETPITIDKVKKALSHKSKV